MGIYNTGNKVINESYIMSGDDIVMNFNKWQKGKSNILYVTGLSGSGKTTLAEEYEKKYNAEMFEIDGIEGDYDSSKSNMLKKVKDKFPEFNGSRRDRFKGLNGYQIKILLRKAILFVISEMHKNKDTLYILEGLQIFECLDPNTLKDKPLIIKGTSVTKSIYQRTKRSIKISKEEENIDWIKELTIGFPHLFGWYVEMEKDLTTFKKGLKEGCLILESSNSERKYKCPYCPYTGTRQDLISHIDEEHEKMIPKEYTATRIVFNLINKKTEGSCIQCHRDSGWNEEVGRYNRICFRKKCHDDYVEMRSKRMINVHGTDNLLTDPEFQKVMLSNRKISGSYKFSDGGVRTYCGSYEQKTLEFYDKVLNVPSRDIITPGPIVEYEFEGKTLKWITDIYYIPANLVHDVKDGAENPNGREMPEYRAKQIAKENAIKKCGQYNYIRLTDNKFPQLLLILAEIKEQLLDDSKEVKDPIININESLIGGALANATDADVYIIPYMIDNTFSGVMLSKDSYMRDVYKIEENKIVKTSLLELENCTYNIYKYIGTNVSAIYESIIEDYKNQKVVDSEYYLYEALTGKKMLSFDQLSYDDNFKETIDSYHEAIMNIQCTNATLIHQSRIDNNLYTELTKMEDIELRRVKLLEYNNLTILEDMEGYFVYNSIRESRSRSYENIKDIPDIIIERVARV